MNKMREIGFLRFPPFECMVQLCIYVCVCVTCLFTIHSPIEKFYNHNIYWRHMCITCSYIRNALPWIWYTCKVCLISTPCLCFILWLKEEWLSSWNLGHLAASCASPCPSVLRIISSCLHWSICRGVQQCWLWTQALFALYLCPAVHSRLMQAYLEELSSLISVLPALQKETMFTRWIASSN